MRTFLQIQLKFLHLTTSGGNLKHLNSIPLFAFSNGPAPSTVHYGYCKTFVCDYMRELTIPPNSVSHRVYMRQHVQAVSLSCSLFIFKCTPRLSSAFALRRISLPECSLYHRSLSPNQLYFFAYCTKNSFSCSMHNPHNPAAFLPSQLPLACLRHTQTSSARPNISAAQILIIDQEYIIGRLLV